MTINTKCQVFTPKAIVEQLLDSIEYKEHVFGKKVAETSCGDGNILVLIVERFIQDALHKNKSLSTIKKELEEDIWGFEIDPEHASNCKINLDNIAHRYGISSVSWNVIEGDFLKQNITDKFDFVISNPPYIKYSDLDIETRSFVKNNFVTCSIGKFDYCYPFVEGSLNALKPSGKMAYLVPSNIFKNQFAYELRKFILPHLTAIYDFTSQQLFEKKLTASAFILCDKHCNSKSFQYVDVSTYKKEIIKKGSLSQKWVFKKNSLKAKQSFCFADFFHASSSIATLLNEAYIIPEPIEHANYIEKNGIKIEKNVIRKAVSPRSINSGKDEFLLFPYYFKNNLLMRYTESEFLNSFPGAVKHLQSFSEKLSKRTADKGVSWFEYGRSQAIAHQNQEKLLLSTLVTGKVKATILDSHTIPTSGIYITPKSSNKQFSLEDAKNILLSKYFLEYVQGIGIISGGKSYRISAKDINSFIFPRNLLLKKF